MYNVIFAEGAHYWNLWAAVILAAIGVVWKMACR